MDARSKLSTIDAKIESFIPGKLVVVSAEEPPRLSKNDTEPFATKSAIRKWRRVRIKTVIMVRR